MLPLRDVCTKLTVDGGMRFKTYHATIRADFGCHYAGHISDVRAHVDGEFTIVYKAKERFCYK
jgi:hypothetical protein